MKKKNWTKTEKKQRIFNQNFLLPDENTKKSFLGRKLGKNWEENQEKNWEENQAKKLGRKLGKKIGKKIEKKIGKKTKDFRPKFFGVPRSANT